MKLALIWAMSRNRTIGRDNQLPWHLPEDLKYFKRITMGKPMIMGRRTWDSIGRPLPGRRSIVVSRNPDFTAPGAEVVHSLDDAMALAAGICANSGADEAQVIGGADIFNCALPLAHRLYLTQVHAEVAGDTFFPEFDLGQWQQVAREDHAASEDNPYDYSFIVLERLTA